MDPSEQVNTVPRYHVRLMSKEDIPQVLQIWKQNGLFEGTCTIQSFLDVDPNGFFVAVDDDDGNIIGSCAGVFVDPKTAFIGLYSVKPCFQGNGIGMKMWKMMMDHINEHNAGLYAVPKHLTTYRDRAGFQIQDDKMIISYNSDSIDTSSLVNKIDSITVRFIDSSNIASVIDYDSTIICYNRGKLLLSTFKENDTVSMVAIDSDDNVKGYGCVKTSNTNSAMAGPIYADNDAIAELILFNIIENFPLARKGIDLMVPNINPGAIRIAKKLGLEKQSELPRFFTKFIPKADFDRIYCIHTPNFSPF